MLKGLVAEIQEDFDLHTFPRPSNAEPVLSLLAKNSEPSFES